MVVMIEIGVNSPVHSVYYPYLITSFASAYLYL